MRSRWLRVGRATSTALIAAGVLALADAAVTVAWQEPVTALQAAVRAGSLADELEALERAGPTRAELRRLAGERDARERTRVLAAGLRERTRPGDAVGRVVLPRLGVDEVVVAGSAGPALERGPGLFDGQPWPGEGGTVAVAGHRTTFGAPFRDLDRLRPGDRVEVRLPYVVARYAVVRTRVVEPSAVWVLRDRGRERLLLTACHPVFSAAQRIVVEARLVEHLPTQRARATRAT